MKIIGPVTLGVVATFVFLQPAQGRGGGHASFSGGHFSGPSMHYSGGYSRGYSGGRPYYAPSARYSSGATYRNRGYARSYSRTANRPTAYNPGYYSASGSRSGVTRTAAYRNRNYSTANLTSTRTAGRRTQGFDQGRIVGRQGAGWHRNWDRSHDHSWHGHRCHWHNNGWIIYDPWPYWWGYGLYPYYPYYSSYDDGYYDDSYSSNEYPQEQHPTETVYDSSRVSQVQSALSREGYYSGAIDGRLNANTRAALRNYQRDHHLAVTGNIDRGILEGLRLR
jgi:hypothetical protein